MSIDEPATLPVTAKECGAKKVAEGEEEQSGQLLQKLLESRSGKGAGKKQDKKMQKVVHLVDNLPPLPGKIVELIQEGSFVDYAWFPVL